MVASSAFCILSRSISFIMASDSSNLPSSPSRSAWSRKKLIFLCKLSILHAYHVPGDNFSFISFGWSASAGMSIFANVRRILPSSWAMIFSRNSTRHIAASRTHEVVLVAPLVNVLVRVLLIQLLEVFVVPLGTPADVRLRVGEQVVRAECHQEIFADLHVTRREVRWARQNAPCACRDGIAAGSGPFP